MRLTPKKKANSLRVSLFNFARSSLYYLIVSVANVSTATATVGVTATQESTQVESVVATSSVVVPEVQEVKATAKTTITVRITFFIGLFNLIYLVFISAEDDLF